MEKSIEEKNKSCSNCCETIKECACLRNKCTMCGKPVGNITFVVCDDCWDKYPLNTSKPKPMKDKFEEWYKENERTFHCGHYDDKQIAHSAWLAANTLHQQALKEILQSIDNTYGRGHITKLINKIAKENNIEL